MYASCAESYYYHCDDCGEYVSRRNLWVERNLTICYHCYDNYCVCDDCGDVIHSDYIHCINGYVCDDSRAVTEMLYGIIIINPSHDFTANCPSGQRLYGLELEIDYGDDKREAARVFKRPAATAFI